MKVAIVKYNAGNTCSVLNALQRLGVEGVVSDDPQLLRSADRVIFPGVGEASTAIQYLRDRRLDKVIRDLKQPVLAICLGMQLLGESSEENDAAGLGIIPFHVVRFSGHLRVPHIGWNQISNLKSEISDLRSQLPDFNSSLFAGIHPRERFYFVHSYYVPVNDQAIAVTDYGTQFSSAARHKNFYGVQFHPEKSGEAGARLIRNFLELPNT